MILDQDTITRVRASYARLRPRVHEASARFYEILFEIAPEYRSMFRDDLEGQGMKFMTTLGVVIDHLDHPDEMRARLADLARGHKALGVTMAHYGPMGEALVRTVRETLGEDCAAQDEWAWRAAYVELAAAMIDAAER